MIVRFEPWGAWIKLETTAAVVALDRDGVRALGLDGADAWTDGARAGAPIEVHLAVTSRCGAGCKGCYLDARPNGSEPPLAQLRASLDTMSRSGVFTVAFGGGEPTTRDDVDALAEHARARGMTPVLTTSGLGLSDARIAKLRAFAQVNVSYDGEAGTYDRVRGFDGAAAAEAAIERLAAAGIPVGVNVVVTHDSFPHLRETLLRARSLGAREAQLLRYKPAGRAASLDYFARRLGPIQARALGEVIRSLSAELCREGAFALRIDCALVPFLSADPALSQDAAGLARLGVFGCEAGGALAAITADGRVAPCSFASPTSLPWNRLAELHDEPELERWRAHAAAPPEPCASCSLRAVCKGGCKVVARFVSNTHGPDPECPRVLAHGGDATA